MYTTSDISDAESMRQVVKLLIASRNAEVKQIHFPPTLGASNVSASKSAIHGAVQQFLGTSSGVPHSLLAEEGGGGVAKIYTNGGRVKMVAWHRGGNTYWISNSLLDSPSNDQMVSTARSVSVIVPKPEPARRKG